MDQRMLIPTETLVDDRTDVTTDDEIRLAPGDGGFQVEGPGMLDTFVVRSTDPDFKVKAETDKTLLIDDDWSTLHEFSGDLSHISAYEDDGDHIVVVQNYPYREWSTAAVDPLSKMTFERIRGEWILGVPVSF